jgi:transketolase
MKKLFFDLMLQHMTANEDIVFILAGLGYPRYDEFKQRFPDRVYNFEASEQTCLDSCVGLAYAGKIPVVYTITPFYWRAAETIRTYLSHENLPCVLVGAGVGEEYAVDDGFSHSGTDIKDLFNIFPNFMQFYPDGQEELSSAIIEAIGNKKPNFINLHR